MKEVKELIDQLQARLQNAGGGRNLNHTQNIHH